MSIIQSLIGRSSGVVVALTNQSASLAGKPSEGLGLRRNGEAYIDGGGFGNVILSGQWVASGSNSTIGDSYEARMTPGPGVTIAGGSDATGVWLQISGTGRIWLLTTTGYFDVEIRPFGGGATLATARITIT